MANNFPSWEDWVNMTEDQKQYAIWSKLYELQNQKKIDRIVQFFGAFSGAVVTLSLLQYFV